MTGSAPDTKGVLTKGAETAFRTGVLVISLVSFGATAGWIGHKVVDGAQAKESSPVVVQRRIGKIEQRLTWLSQVTRQNALITRSLARKAGIQVLEPDPEPVREADKFEDE